MGVGYNTILKIKRLEEECAAMGMKVGYPKRGWNSDADGDILAVTPVGDALPVYCRDAELFVGNLDELSRWLQGVQWARNYYTMLKVVDEKRVEKKEQDLKNEQLVRKLKSEQVDLKE